MKAKKPKLKRCVDVCITTHTTMKCISKNTLKFFEINAISSHIWICVALCENVQSIILFYKISTNTYSYSYTYTNKQFLHVFVYTYIVV